MHQIRAYDFAANRFFETDRYLGYTEFKPGVTKDGPAKIDLALARVGPDGKPKDDEPYTAGSYVCEMLLDGKVEGTAPFNIDFPPCPPAYIVVGGPCYRFYPAGQQCPKYGEKSRDQKQCRCSEAKGWECDEG
jgi:hypothetical protein